MTRLTTVGYVPPARREGAGRQATRDFVQSLAEDRKTASHGRGQTPPSDQAHAASSNLTSQAPVQPGVSDSTVTEASASGHLSTDDVLMATVERGALAVAVSPVGMTEALQYARVFGAHLLPDCYLSEVAVSDAVGGSTTSARVGSASSGETTASASSLQADALPAFTAGARQPSPAQEAIIAMGTMEGEAESSPVAETMSSSDVASSPGASTVVWSERTLRITGEREGHAVAWIRDYRLGSHDEERLVQAVLQEARMQGVMLKKVIVNGREAWASREAI